MSKDNNTITVYFKKGILNYQTYPMDKTMTQIGVGKDLTITEPGNYPDPQDPDPEVFKPIKGNIATLHLDKEELSNIFGTEITISSQRYPIQIKIKNNTLVENVWITNYDQAYTYEDHLVIQGVNFEAEKRASLDDSK